MKQTCRGCNLLFLGPFLDDNLLCRKCKLKPANIKKIIKPDVRTEAELEGTIAELRKDNKLLGREPEKLRRKIAKLEKELEKTKYQSPIHKIQEVSKIYSNTTYELKGMGLAHEGILESLSVELKKLSKRISIELNKSRKKYRRPRFKTDCEDYKKLTKKQKLIYSRIRARHLDNPQFEGELISVKDYVDYILKIDFKCVYCPKDATGFDRIDSKITYAEGNIQPCCVTCNRMKWTMSEEQFKEHLNLIRGK